MYLKLIIRAAQRTAVKKPRDLNSKAIMGLKSLGDPLSAVEILIQCQKQSLVEESGCGNYVHTCLMSSDSMKTKKHTMQRKLLKYDKEFTNNVQYILHFVGSVMIKSLICTIRRT